MNKNEILRIYGKNYKENTIRILEESNLANLISGPSARIGIKPNLVAPTPAIMGATTHPEVVAGLIEYLKAHGFDNIVIMEGSWVGDKTEDSFDVCGYNELSSKYNVKLIDTQKCSGILKECKGISLNICDCLADVDFLINVPVLKGHAETRITCALKNMKGLIPNSEKRRFHAMGLHDPIAHLSVGIHQDFILVDHICGDLDFEDGGNPIDTNCIMTALDPVLLDAYVCRLLGYELSDVPYILKAHEIGSGSIDIDNAIIKTLGESQDYEEHLRPSHHFVEIMDKVTEVDSCSACYASLLPALDSLKDEGLLDVLYDKYEKICIGQAFKNKTGALGVGTCTSHFMHSVRGCPPKSEDVYTALKKLI